MKAIDLLTAYTTFTTFRDGQEETINSVLAGRHTFSRLRTGGGKSLCYLLPSYALGGLTVIVSPLLSLMEDQVQQIVALGEKRVVALNSFLSGDEKAYVLERLHTYRFIFVSPEMMQNREVLRRIRQVGIRLFVIDEAHCLTHWGSDFRPDYLRLVQSIRQTNPSVCLLLSATADDACMERAVEALGLQASSVSFVRTSSDRPNVFYHVERCASDEEKMDTLLRRLGEVNGAGIVYCTSRQATEWWAEQIATYTGQCVRYYHAGLSNEERLLVQEQFMRGELRCICATSAFGMGVNKPDIRWVFHASPSLTFHDYVQEAGRAGRDGEQSVAVLFVSPADVRIDFERHQRSSIDEAMVDAYLAFRQSPMQRKTLFREWYPYANETNERMLDFYYEQFRSDKARMVSEASTQKMRKIQANERMVQFVSANVCIRRTLLNAFEETLTHTPERCCSICQPEYASFPWFGEQTENKSLSPTGDWRVRLQSLFAMKEGGNDETSQA
ncbi:MAG: RecQ family ATP-dependent DNA helicase [Bacilli bacterium]